jgi:hypothetical protein
MSKSSRKRTRITLALGGFSVITSGSLYGVVANGAAAQSVAAPAPTAAHNAAARTRATTTSQSQSSTAQTRSRGS